MPRNITPTLAILTLCVLPSIGQSADQPPLPTVDPKLVGIDADSLARIDPVIEGAIKKDQLPGAVVLVLRRGKIAYRKAYGLRSKFPKQETMTTDTIFDLASLTKPIATATSLMILLEQGKFRLKDRVSRFLPELKQHGKDKITIEQLLLHVSGLPPGSPVKDYHAEVGKTLKSIDDLKLIAEPGDGFRYSDIGYVVLGALVERISGEPLDVFARKHVYAPLGMNATGFKPSKDHAARIAPTEKVDDAWLRGVVHDPRARRMGGVAGHAGLFSTADDLARYALMLLNKGKLGDRRILSPAAVGVMTTPRDVPRGKRALGWDVDTAYSSNRGELFPVGGFGHTGFTGTSIWMDPSSETAVIFLSHRVHPSAKGRSVIRLRNQVATLVAASMR